MSSRRYGLTAIAVLTVLSATGACAAGTDRAVATIARPADLVTPAGRGDPHKGAQAYLDIVVRAYQPASDGSLQIVVERPDPTGYLEIARFGLFPERAFAASEPAQAQRFSFPLDGATLPRRVRVRLLPISGTGRAASADVAARIVRHG